MKLLSFLSFITILFFQNTQAQFDDQFYFPSKKIIAIDNLKYENITLLVEKDTLITILIKPNKKVKATILYFHGNSGNYSENIELIKPLVEDGYQVFMAEYRGYGNSTGKPTHLNIARDSQVIFDFLINIKEVKNTKIIIYGSSIGCQVATNLTMKNQTKIKALILDSGFASFTDIALASRPVEQHSTIKYYVTSPYAAKDDICKIENVNKLIIQSQKDEVAPFEQGKLLFDNAKEPKTFYEYQGNHIEAMKIDSAKLLIEINKLL
jgi:esterase/lipase